MTASGGLYPSLGRHFKSMTELAHAGCMSVRRLRDCLDGVEEFTRFEKKAILNAIAIKEHGIKVEDDFDGRFRRKVGKA